MGFAADFAAMRGHKYALLVTFRREGGRADAGLVALFDDRHFVT
jgi:hypothetical protein